MKTSLQIGSSEVVVADKPIIIMVETKMAETQTDPVLAEKKSSLEKETQDVKVFLDPAMFSFGLRNEIYISDFSA